MDNEIQVTPLNLNKVSKWLKEGKRVVLVTIQTVSFRKYVNQKVQFSSTIHPS